MYNLLPREVWNSIREEHIRKHGAKCEICGSPERPLQLHERWRYDDRRHVQRLVGFQLLCRKCHLVKHIGLAGILADRGELDYEELVEHFCRVNGCSKEDFRRHADRAFEVWAKRSVFQWVQDFGEYGRYIDGRMTGARLPAFRR